MSDHKRRTLPTGATAYARRDGAPVHISEVAQGHACGCVCQYCGGKLSAHKGPVQIHHFQHIQLAECEGAGESILHERAKLMVASLNDILLPSQALPVDPAWIPLMPSDVSADICGVHWAQVSSGRVEADLKGLRPDVELTLRDGSLLHVEVVVHHDVSRQKLRLLRRLNLRTLRIVLEPSDEWLTLPELEAKLIEGLQIKDWLFQPEQREAERAIAQAKREALRLRRRKPAPRWLDRQGPHIRSQYTMPGAGPALWFQAEQLTRLLGRPLTTAKQNDIPGTREAFESNRARGICSAEEYLRAKRK